MFPKTKFAALLAMTAMLLVPTAALAEGPTYAPAPVPTHPKKPMPGPNAPAGQLTKAYGAKCKGFSKKHVKGQAATPFSRCVKAMATAASTKKTAKVACVGLSKVHVKGQAGTEFSRCVVAAAKVKKEVAAS
jgi:hypothetical protein